MAKFESYLPSDGGFEDVADNLSEGRAILEEEYDMDQLCEDSDDEFAYLAGHI